MDLFLEGKIIRKIYVFCICVGVTCSSAMLSRSIGGRPGWQKLGGASMPACVEWSSCRAITPSFSACLSHFVQRHKKNSARRGAIGEEHKAWQSHSHRPLIHNSINVENLFLRCSARAQREVCWWAQKKPLLPSVTEIWMSIRVCVTIWTFAFIRS